MENKKIRLKKIFGFVKGISLLWMFAIPVIIAALLNSEPVLAKEINYERMYSEALDFPKGNLQRLAAALKKAEQGNEITVGFIGGSITEGYNASAPQNNYVNNVCGWLKNKFPCARINAVNAGIGGTSSYLGVHRVEKELLEYSPDIVFVDFSVNDYFAYEQMQSYENLIRRILCADSNPAVILLFMPKEDGVNMQEVQSAVGAYYRLPMISYADAVFGEMEKGDLAWRDISDDVVHPNDLGHSIIAILIEKYLDEVYMRADKLLEGAGYTMPLPVTKEIYSNAFIADASNIIPVFQDNCETGDINRYFKNSWNFSGEGGEIIFMVDAANCGIMYQGCTEGYMGQYDVFVDGAYITTLDGNEDGRHGADIQVQEILNSDTVQRHSIRIKKNTESPSGIFAILGLMIS